MAVELRNDLRAKIAREARFHHLEARIDQAGDNPEELKSLLAELKAFFMLERPSERHLRLASGTVRLINLLKDDTAALKAYQDFGELFAKSDSRKVARYGGEIIESAKQIRQRLEPVELEGTALDGSKFNITAYRGKVVLLNFWAARDGGSAEQAPHLKAAYEKFHERGFEIVGISLDTDRAALDEFLAEHKIVWTNIFSSDAGGGAQLLAKQFKVLRLPATFLLGRDGKIVAKDVSGEALAGDVEKLLSVEPK
jgi:peroxiredoxin